jgi:hypothetical protein
MVWFVAKALFRMVLMLPCLFIGWCVGMVAAPFIIGFRTALISTDNFIEHTPAKYAHMRDLRAKGVI